MAGDTRPNDVAASSQNPFRKRIFGTFFDTFVRLSGFHNILSYNLTQDDGSDTPGDICMTRARQAGNPSSLRDARTEQVAADAPLRRRLVVTPQGRADNPMKINEAELIRDYGLRGPFKVFRLRARILWSLTLAALAKRAPTSGITVFLQRRRGVTIGRHVFIGHGVEIDLLYPHLVTIGNYVSLGMHALVFAHTNPTCSLDLKMELYPRTTAPVVIKDGAWIMARCIILQGVTIGENAAVGAGSLVRDDVAAKTVAAGSPARTIRVLEID